MDSATAPTATSAGTAAHARLLDLALDAIFVRDAAGLVTFWNAGAHRLYGWSADEALGRPVGELLATRYPEGEDRVVATAADQGSWEGELLQTARDGRAVRVESRWVADVDPEGRLAGFLEVNRDITARRSAEQRFRRLLEAAPDAMVIADALGRIAFTNDRAYELFGYDAPELVGEAIEILLPARFRAGHAGLRREYADAPRARPMGAGLELAGRRRDGTEFPVEVSLSPLETDEGTLISAAIRDITGRKEVERRLRDQAGALARSNAELEQFAYVASHDLQEPLRKIASFCQLLKDDYGDRLDEMADTYIDYAVDGAVRMKELINDLLEFSRVGRREMEVESVDVRAVVESVLGNLDTVRDEAAATIDVGPLPTIAAERFHLVQLYQNLVGNALKFRSPDRPCRIAIGARREADRWLFWVADNGIGIDGAYTASVFDVFRRLHARSEFPGTGIGLAICRRIVARMAGTIWVESEPGRGSTFLWTVPVV